MANYVNTLDGQKVKAKLINNYKGSGGVKLWKVENEIESGLLDTKVS